MKIIEKKNNQRKIFLDKRFDIFKKNKSASRKLHYNLENLLFFKNSKKIASFISIKTEISTLFLNEFILSKNKILCLPVIEMGSENLIFRQYKKNDKLIVGKFGVMQPDANKKIIFPEIILTPCLAFDQNGYRLGYGGGYYDKTFSFLKKINRKFISIAVAFDGQKSDKVFHEDFDIKIDYILTEKKLYKVK